MGIARADFKGGVKFSFTLQLGYKNKAPSFSPTVYSGLTRPKAAGRPSFYNRAMKVKTTGGLQTQLLSTAQETGTRPQGNGSDAYPFLVVEGADGDLLFLAASWAPTVQTQVPGGLGADFHRGNQAGVIRR